MTQITNRRVTDLTVTNPAEQVHFSRFNENQSRMTRDDYSVLQSHLKKNYGKNISQEDMFLIMEVHRQ